MNDSNFDRHFRDQLGDHSTPVDTDAIWSGVQAGLKSQAPQKITLWKRSWLLLLLLLLGGIGVGWWFSTTPQSKETTAAAEGPQPTSGSVASADVNEKSDRPADIVTGEQEAHRESVFDVLKAHPGDSVGVVKSEEKVARATEPFSQVDQRKESDESSSAFVVDKTIAENSIELSGKEEESETRESVKPDTEKTEDDPGTNSKEASEKEPTVTEDFNGVVEEKSAENQTREKLMSTDGVDLPASIEDFPTSAEKENSPAEVIEIDSTDMSQTDTLVQPSNLVLSADTIAHTVSENPAEQKPDPSRSFFVRADFGAGLTNKKLLSKHSDWDMHTSARSNTEKPLEHLGGHLLVGYRLPSGLYAATGISFTQIIEQFHVDRTYSETEIQEDQVSEIHVDMNGDTNYVYTDHHITHHFHQEVSAYNKYTLIDLPVLIGYEWHRQRWYLGLEAGIAINLSLRTAGRMLAPTDEVIALESSGMFRSHISLSYLANLRVGYTLSQRFELFFTPGVHIIPQSLLKQEVQHQAYNLYGIRLGTRFWLK